ncbi:helix-turn-helix domain-containing protein [Flagellimonas pacifica]|uniref:Transcriptional regulatory protein, C terminal n=1 Tax=Flagellimonas pacifica TaxID=1247520 RepID=A0A285MDC4_9FLAO|nr:helix-turn-helix domain-containing protein [Allomuricauda parva]SNY95098.1 Transcriptional regulatory protein, C terminal [Allomuricauda parva]
MKAIIHLYSVLVLLTLSFIVIDYSPSVQKEAFPSLVKVALRNTGNTLLLQSKDSSSLILPVVELEQNKFQLSFQKELPISPDSLVVAVTKNFQALNLPNEYLVEVVECQKEEVSYSYYVFNDKEKNIVPCMGRNLPLHCYTINVQFNKRSSLMGFNMGSPWFSLVLLGAMGVGLFYYWIKRKQTIQVYDSLAYSTIGGYHFYKDQNKLVKDGLNIKLTSKESELLQIFCDNPNQVVKRDFLLKEVWEDKGVFVGRSLDTFISKIRKKFKDDNDINLLNVHGVGYKLEIVRKSRR